MLCKAVFDTVCPDGTGTGDGLTEVCVDGRTSNRVDTLQLSRGGDVETLMKKKA